MWRNCVETLSRGCPGARIEGLEKKPLIRVVGEEEAEEKEKTPKKEKSEAEKKGKKSFIKVLD